MTAPDQWYHCPCGELFAGQLRYEHHLFHEHNQLRDTLPAVVCEPDG